MSETIYTKDTSGSTTDIKHESIVNILQNHPYYSPFLSIIYWENPILTGKILVVGNLIFFLLNSGGCTLFSILSTTFLILMFVSFCYVNIPALRNIAQPLLSGFNGKDLSISTELMTKHVETALHLQEATRLYISEIIYFSDQQKSLKAAVVALTLFIIGSWFSDVTILHLNFLVLMIWPRLYKSYQVEIDRFVSLALGKLQEKVIPLLDKLPPPIKEKVSVYFKHKQE